MKLMYKDKINFDEPKEKDVIEFLSDIEEDNLKDFVERRIKK